MTTTAYSFVPDFIEAETTYTVKWGQSSKEKKVKWSEEVEFTTLMSFRMLCMWKEVSWWKKEKGSILLMKWTQELIQKQVIMVIAQP